MYEQSYNTQKRNCIKKVYEYWCKCSLCQWSERTQYTWFIFTSKVNKTEEEIEEENRFQYEAKLAPLIETLKEKSISFVELIQYLAPDNKNLKGDVMIPEFIIFSLGKPKCLIYFDYKLKEIKATSNEAKLSIQNLLKFLTFRYRLRRTFNSSNKGIYLNKSYETKKSVINSQSNIPMVKVIYKTEQELLSQSKFTELMLKRPNDKIWKQIIYIQSNVGISDFVSETIPYNYFAPINIENPKEKIKYVSTPNPIQTISL